LNKDKAEDSLIVSYWYQKFREALIHKSPTTKSWMINKDAYNGNYFKNKKNTEYKSDSVSNYVFSIVETIRPLMMDNDPKFQALPRNSDGLQFASDLQDAFNYEWDRENMNMKMYSELINFLTIGNAIFHVPWDSANKQIRMTPVSPFNIFPDPLATSFEDAEYIIYARYIAENTLKNTYPEKADRIHGGNINYIELVNGVTLNQNVTNQVLALEVYARDYSFEEVLKDGKSTMKYPNGRVFTICPEINLMLEDKALPYSDKDFPFVHFKDYDMPGVFWGEGEVTQLLSPQKQMNDLNNAIIDNAKAVANMPWVIDKNSGIPVGAITARPGLIIRKNPGTEVKRDQAPQMPNYVQNVVEIFKNDMEMISGVHNTLRGENTTGVYTAQGIIALQEAGQIRIRLKVKMIEEGFGKLGCMTFSRMKQFWKSDKWIRITKHDGTYDMKKFTTDKLKYDYDIRVVGGSTMPINRGAMLDFMVRLAQTQMPDGQPLVDREAVMEYLPQEAKAGLLDRMKDSKLQVEQQMEQLMQAVQQTNQQLQQLAQESAKNDEDIFKIIEQITASIEKLSKQTLQNTERYDTMVKEKQEEEKLDKIKRESYNTGYKDAESMTEEMTNMGVTSDETETPLDALPDELLEGLENLTDDQLAVLLEKNPELIDLLK